MNNYSLTLTKELIEECRSDKGAFTSETARLLGANFPLVRGWVKSLEGKSIDGHIFAAAKLARNPPHREAWVNRSRGQLGLFS